MSGDQTPGQKPGAGAASGPAGRVRGLGRQAATLGLAGLGGGALALTGVPLGWMIGAMLTTQAMAMAGFPATVARPARNIMVAVLGVMLGSAFTPDLMAAVDRWAVTLASIPIYVAVGTVLGIAYLRWVARFDPVTAYFTATPGGFGEMTLIGAEAGGDERIIALTHAARILIVVATVPLWLQALPGGPSAVAAGAGTGAAGDLPPPADLALLAACALGAPVARLARLPAAWLLGPMAVSAVIHLIGWTDSRPPAALIALAQVVVGAYIGSRFAGTPVRLVARVLLIAAGLAAILLAWAGLVAWVLSAVTGFALVDLILAFAPGGVSEMSLVALALNVDAAFVATHHLARIALIVVTAPLVFRWLARRRRSKE